MALCISLTLPQGPIWGRGTEHLLSNVLCTQNGGQLRMRMSPLVTGLSEMGLSALDVAFKKEFKFNSWRPRAPVFQTLIHRHADSSSLRVHRPSCWHRCSIRLKCLVECKYLTGYFSVWRVTGILICSFNGFWGYERLSILEEEQFSLGFWIKRSDWKHRLGNLS